MYTWYFLESGTFFFLLLPIQFDPCPGKADPEHARTSKCARSITGVFRGLNPPIEPDLGLDEFRTCKQGVDPVALACCEHRLPLPRHLDRAIMNIPGGAGAPKKETRVDHSSVGTCTCVDELGWNGGSAPSISVSSRCRTIPTSTCRYSTRPREKIDA